MDVEGHRGRARLSIESTEPRIAGRFQLELQTEDEPETYSATVEGTKDRDTIVLRFRMADGEIPTYSASLRTPTAFERGDGSLVDRGIGLGGES